MLTTDLALGADGFNPHTVTSWEWWQYEIGVRLARHANRAAEQGARGEFGVYTDDMPSPEGGRLVRSGMLSGAFQLVRVPRPDWLRADVVRWGDSPGLWQFGEHVVLSGSPARDADGRKLSEVLDPLARRAVNRLAIEADGLCVRARAGFEVRAGVVALGLKIDALMPSGSEE